MDRLLHAVALYHQGEGRYSLVPATGLHRERITDIRPQAPHDLMFKARRDLRAGVTACPQERPRTIQTIRDRVLGGELHVSRSTVDAFADVSAIRRDGVIDETLHDTTR